MDKDPIECMVDAIDADIESKREDTYGNNYCDNCKKRCYGRYCRKCLIHMGIDPDFRMHRTTSSSSSSKHEERQSYVVRESNNDNIWN